MNRVTDDLISRSVLIDELMAGCMPLDLPGLSGVTGDELTIRNYIDSAPSVDAAPVVYGRWVDYKDDHQCSVCKKHTIYDTYVWKAIQFEFCPWCGAKMEAKND